MQLEIDGANKVNFWHVRNILNVIRNLSFFSLSANVLFVTSKRHKRQQFNMLMCAELFIQWRTKQLLPTLI